MRARSRPTVGDGLVALLLAVLVLDRMLRGRRRRRAWQSEAWDLYDGIEPVVLRGPADRLDEVRLVRQTSISPFYDDVFSTISQKEG